MSDIYGAMALMLTLSVALFLAGYKSAERLTPRAFNFVAFATVAALMLYMKFVQESAWLVRALPFSNLIVLGAWQPLFGGFLGGLAWRRIHGRAWRKWVCVAPLIGISLYGAYGRLFGNEPWTEARDYWKNGVCLQTSQSSCSAAAAATLLTAHGIPASETEMARLCFTRSAKGTTWLGLYRGLKLKTAGTEWDVEVLQWNLAELQAGSQDASIISVRLDPHPGIDPRFEQNWGWEPGVQHAVVLFGFHPDGRIEMGDPSVGREFWNEHSLRELWHGDCMRLVPRTK